MKNDEKNVQEEINVLKTKIEILDEQKARVEEAIAQNNMKLQEIESEIIPWERKIRIMGIAFAIGLAIGFVVFMVR